MSTGIGFLDNLIHTVNTGITAVQNGITNAQSYITNTTTQAQNQLSNFVQSISNTVTGATQQFVQPLSQPGTTYSPQIYNPYGNQYVQYQQPQQLGGYLTVPTQTNITLSGFDFNTVYTAVNAAFAHLPEIINTIQNPLSSPLTQQLVNIIQNLYNQQTSTVDSVKQLVKDVESHLYQSASSTLSNIGIDVGNFSTLLDATARIVMEQLGYDFNQRMTDIENMNRAGQAELNQKIYNTQSGINQFLQSLSYEFADTNAILKSLGEERGVGATVPPKDLISQAIDSAGNELIKVLQQTYDYATTNPNSFVQQLGSRIDAISGVIEDLKSGKFRNTDQFFAALFGNEPSTSLARSLVILASVFPTLISAVNSAGNPALEAFSYLVNASNPVKILGIGEYVNAYFKDVIDYGTLKNHAAKMGIGETELKTLLSQSFQDPPFNLMVEGKRRGFVTDDNWHKYLVDERLDNDGQVLVTKLLQSIPGPSDLTRIADKRVWGLKTDLKYGQYAELPEEYVIQMSKWGYDRQFIEWLWASHWQLPSPNQIFEMAHRGLIDQHDIETFLGLTDWLPFFRDKLFQITYNVFTRVDVRRLYKEGLLTDTELHEQHKKMGYTDADAYKLDAYVRETNLPEDETENTALIKRVVKAIENGYTSGKLQPEEAIQMLTQMGETENHARQIIGILEFENEIKNIQPIQLDLRGNVRTIVLNAYKKGNISRLDAHDYLESIGLPNQDIDLHLNLIELERTVQLKSMAQDTAQKLFAQYSIDTAEFYSRLGSLGFAADEMALIYQEALLMRDNRTKKLTVAQVTKLFKNGIIGIEQYADELRGIGYTDKDVLYIIENDIAELGG